MPDKRIIGQNKVVIMGRTKVGKSVNGFSRESIKNLMYFHRWYFISICECMNKV